MRIRRPGARLAGWISGLWLLAAVPTLQAASLETLVMPGPVIEGHADTEETCSACHGVFERAAQRGLCLECHDDVAGDANAGTGYHGRDPAARTADCKACHTEHKGRDADIVGLQPNLFDHGHTDFALTGAHTSVACASCHEPGRKHRQADGDCAACHQDDDVHQGELGTECADCHTLANWAEADFDHDTTDFPLRGVHAETTCLGCHESRLFAAPGAECIDCHRIDDAHEGRNGTQCADCHGVTSWETQFDHQAETGFALVGAHATLACRNCHVDESSYEGLPADCNGCHAGDDVHLGRNGPACGDCHQQDRWSIAFDHEAETGYALIGTHATQSCTDCHTTDLETPLPVECIGCHDRDDPHDGTLDTCKDCHGQFHWDEDLRFQHDLTPFALVGLHRVVSCEQCHDSLVFSPVDHDCLTCHDDEDVHGGAMGSECGTCHNPAGWDLWTFDHAVDAGFPLEGAHASLVCADCHPPNRPVGKQTRACVACHRGDDVHRGRFGQDCDRCHLSTSFEELKDEL
ncbi:MAG: hypothetical protein AB7I04_04605 [Pseudomonadales bacterium]